MPQVGLNGNGNTALRPRAAGGRHPTPRGFAADAEKYPAATLQGRAVVRLVSMQLTPETVKQVLAYARDRVRVSGEPLA